MTRDLYSSILIVPDVKPKPGANAMTRDHEGSLQRDSPEHARDILMDQVIETEMEGTLGIARYRKGRNHELRRSLLRNLAPFRSPLKHSVCHLRPFGRELTGATAVTRDLCSSILIVPDVKPKPGANAILGHRSHFGSRYKSGCCGHAGLFGEVLWRRFTSFRIIKQRKARKTAGNQRKAQA